MGWVGFGHTTPVFDAPLPRGVPTIVLVIAPLTGVVWGRDSRIDNKYRSFSGSKEGSLFGSPSLTYRLRSPPPEVPVGAPRHVPGTPPPCPDLRRKSPTLRPSSRSSPTRGRRRMSVLRRRLRRRRRTSDYTDRVFIKCGRSFTWCLYGFGNLPVSTPFLCIFPSFVPLRPDPTRPVAKTG